MQVYLGDHSAESLHRVFEIRLIQEKWDHASRSASRLCYPSGGGVPEGLYLEPGELRRKFCQDSL